MQTGFHDYLDGETRCRGYLAHDLGHAKRPAVLVAPTWAGRDVFACGKAEALAQLGYVGFALDLYGEGRIGTSPEENRALMGPLASDRRLLARRMRAALDAVRSLPAVDPDRVAAIGFCFGGLAVLDLARSGADLRGVVSFHGLLHPPGNAEKRRITAKVLVLHGWDDPMAPPDHVKGLADELTAAQADFQIHAYGHTKHAFTNPFANDDVAGTVYQPTAFRRAWQSMRAFLQEALV